MKKKLAKSSIKSSRNSPKKVGLKPPKRNRIYFELALTVAFGVAISGIAYLWHQVDNHFCANSISCIHNLSAQVENNTPGFFDGQQIMPPTIDLAQIEKSSRVLGASTEAGDKHIFVDLSTQTLYAYQGITQVMDTLISSGKWNPTPPGDYHIWVKIRSTRMSGGEGADAYDLPNVPFTMYFYNDKVGKGEGYSLHGAYWHDNFGHMMSHGCVNMRMVDAEAVYNWADPPTVSSTTYATSQNPGTVVSICKTVQLQPGATPLCVQ